jgi:nucleoside-triphosphatase THEP1
MERQVKHVDDVVEHLVVYNKKVQGCVRHNRDIMLSLARTGEDNWHDWFLTTEQTETLIKQLQEGLKQNKENE